VVRSLASRDAITTQLILHARSYEDDRTRITRAQGAFLKRCGNAPRRNPVGPCRTLPKPKQRGPSTTVTLYPPVKSLSILSLGCQFFGIHASNHGRIMIFAGGIPLKENGKVVGAIGASGGSGEQDHATSTT
jgi:hypothetical protein